MICNLRFLCKSYYISVIVNLLLCQKQTLSKKSHGFILHVNKPSIAAYIYYKLGSTNGVTSFPV